MKRNLTLLTTLIFSIIHVFSCDFTVYLHDTFGDGWNGNSATIYVNGVPVLSGITIDTGSDASFTFSANQGDNISITFDDSGSFDSECEITIANDSNLNIFEDGLDYTVPAGGTVTIGENCGLAPPSNDDPCNAIPVPAAPMCDMLVYDNSFATDSGEPDPGCGSYNGADLWFVVPFPVSGVLTIETEAMTITDGVLGIYSSPTNDCANLVLDQCIDNGTDMPTVSLSGYTPGDMIWIRFWEDGGDNNGTFSMCVTDIDGPPSCVTSTPAGDECSTATMICNLDGYCGNTSSTYTPGIDPSIFCGSVENSSWISFEAGATEATLYVWTSNCEDDNGIQMEIYESADCQNFASVSQCISPGVVQDFSITATGLVVGEIYYLMIDGYAGDVCDYVVSAGAGVMTADAVVVETGIPTASICGGCVHLLATGGTAYEWSPAGSLDDPNIANPLACPDTTTTYTVTVTGGNPDCPSNATATTTVYIEAQFDAEMSGTNPICNGGTTGTATVTLSDLGSSTDFTYVWSSGDIVGPTIDSVCTITGLGAGTHYVSITDQTGECESVQSITLVDPPLVTLDLSMTPSYCGGGDGTITVGVIDGTSPYDISWSDTYNVNPTNGSVIDQLNNYLIEDLEDLTYNIVVVDSNSCEGIGTITVEDSLALAAEMAVSADQCLLGNQFNFTDLTGSSATFNYKVISPSNTTQIFLGNPHYNGFVANEAGTWTVIQMASLGVCTNEDTLTFNVHPQPVLSETHEDVSCMNGSDASITASSTVPGTYQMLSGSGNFVGATANNLTAGNYTFYVSTDNVCTDTMSVEITQPESLLVSITHVDAICETAGSATVTATGGTLPYAYAWDDPNTQTNYVASDIFEGVYTCVVTDANGCTNSISAELLNNNVFDSEIHILNHVSCFEGSNGTLESVPLGGTSPFTYAWSNAPAVTSQNGVHSGLTAGFYEVTVTDYHGCFSVRNATITEPTELVISADYEEPTCFGYSDGSASVDASGGVPPYSYLWSNGENSSFNINLPSDIYDIAVTDANGCVKTITDFVVTQPNEVILALEYEPTICIGQTADIRMVATSSPFTPYTFYWNNLESTDIITVEPVVTTSYSAQVIDNNGCESLVHEVIVEVNPPLGIQAYPARDVICKGETVEVGFLSLGGNGNYTYRLQDGTVISDPAILNPSETTEYEVSITDDCGTPEATTQFTIEVLEAPVPSFHADVKQGCVPLEVKFTQDVASHDDGTQYIWSFSGQASTNTSLEASPTHIFKHEDQYHVTLDIITPFGCQSQAVEHYYIHAYPLPVASFEINPESVTILNPNVYFENHSEGALYSIWNFGDGDSSNTWSPLHTYPAVATDYYCELIAVNRFGCADSLVQRVVINEEITMYLPTGFTPDNDGKNEFFIAKGHGIVAEPFEMIVYDRWGEEIFKSTSINEGWDGKVSGGSYAKSGVYSYIIKFQDVYGVPHEQSGFVNLIR